MYIGDREMIEEEKVSNFNQCIKFFGIPNLKYSQLSYSEKKLYTICRQFYVIGDLDFENLDLSGLDENNKKKVVQLIEQLMDTF